MFNILRKRFLASLLIKYNIIMVINVTKMNTIPSFIIVLIKPVLILTKYDSTGVKTNDNIINNSIVMIKYFNTSISFTFFNIFLVTRFVFNNMFTKKAMAVPNNIPFIPKKFISIIDNTKLVMAHIKICFLLSLNRPSAFINATSG